MVPLVGWKIKLTAGEKIFENILETLPETVNKKKTKQNTVVREQTRS